MKIKWLQKFTQKQPDSIDSRLQTAFPENYPEARQSTGRILSAIISPDSKTKRYSMLDGLLRYAQRKANETDGVPVWDLGRSLKDELMKMIEIHALSGTKIPMVVGKRWRKRNGTQASKAERPGKAIGKFEDAIFYSRKYLPAWVRLLKAYQEGGYEELFEEKIKDALQMMRIDREVRMICPIAKVLAKNFTQKFYLWLLHMRLACASLKRRWRSLNGHGGLLVAIY